MGSGASCSKLEDLTAEQIGDSVAALGEAYAPYKSSLIQNGISGLVLSSLKDETEMKSLLTDLDIQKPLHQKVLCAHLLKLSAPSAPTTTLPASNPNPAASANLANGAQTTAFINANIDVQDHVTMSPRTIMNKLFDIQGIALDPSDLSSALTKIVNCVGSGFGDGKTTYDCFINYRVNSDADLAEKLYLYLLANGVHAFLDKICLVDGMKWKDGFLTGLKNSRTFIALISSNGLARVRDPSQDHTLDNVLLEYQTAITIADKLVNPKYICPVHVGSFSKGVLTKFFDYSPALYPDSITAMLPPEPPVKQPKKEPKPKAVIAPKVIAPVQSNDEADNEEVQQEETGGEEQEHEQEAEEEEAEENEEAEAVDSAPALACCYKCQQGLAKVTDFPWGDNWGCDWPGHEGDRRGFKSTDPLYGCPTIKKCDWGVCQACWDAINAQATQIAEAANTDDDEGMELQPKGTVSKYNASYYCEIDSVRGVVQGTDDEVSSLLLKIAFNLRGDGSMGELQYPLDSRLFMNSELLGSAESVNIFTKDQYQVRGELLFTVLPDKFEVLFTTLVEFEFGNSGYSKAPLHIPQSKYSFDTSPECAKGHAMVVSDYHSGGYRDGFTCDLCRVTTQEDRWFCKSCSSDFCFSCVPAPAVRPMCANSHEMKRCNKLPPEYAKKNLIVNCDECAKKGIHHNHEFYHCTPCGYDLCLHCAFQATQA